MITKEITKRKTKLTKARQQGYESTENVRKEGKGRQISRKRDKKMRKQNERKEEKVKKK